MWKSISLGTNIPYLDAKPNILMQDAEYLLQTTGHLALLGSFLIAGRYYGVFYTVMNFLVRGTEKI